MKDLLRKKKSVLWSRSP